MKTSLLGGAALAAFPTIIPSSVRGADAPGKKINILMIGCGRIGRSMDMPGLLGQPDLARITAVCDLDSLRVQDAKEMVEAAYAHKGIKITVATYGDYRQALQHPDIDAVAVCTPDHWHAEPVVAAFESRPLTVKRSQALPAVPLKLVTDHKY